MKFSTKSRYALRLMIDLSLHNNGEYTALKDVSERQGISIKYLEQIVSVLTKSGMLKGARGPQGGYKLTKKPTEYTVGDILRVTEGSLAPIPCLENDKIDCGHYNECSTIEFWKGFYDTVNSYVDSVTIDDLAQEYKQKGSFDYVI